MRLRARALAALTVGALSLPGVSHAAPAAARPPVPGAVRFENGWAVPMSTAGPAWYDTAFAKKVLAAGTQGVRLPEGATLPGGPRAVGLASTGIRPGIWLISLITGQGGNYGFAWCTANFVFTKNGGYGLGTAGHCAANDALGGFPDVTAYVVPPVGSGQLPGIYHIGKFVLSHNNGIGDDFAMISIYPQYNSWVNPSMPVWGGPTGTGAPLLVVKHFGHGAGFGAGGTPRAGVATTFTARGGNAFAWYGAGFEGDSGSGVEDVLGTAVGDFTHLVILDGIPGEILPGELAGTRIGKILSIATGWTLSTASLVPSP